MIKNTLTIILLLCFTVAGAKTYQLAPWGNDKNSGNASEPWATFQKACDNLLPGDTLLIREGAYRIEREIRPKNSGTKEQWITYMVAPGEIAVIDAENFVAAADGAYPSRTELGSFHLEKVSFIRVEGLYVRNSRSAGFIVRGPSSNVELIRCKSDRSYNSGIGIWYADHVKVLHCDVTRANEPEMRVPGQTMGNEAPHEAISICGAKHFEVAYNHVHQGFKEGIDVKEVSALGVVHHNYVHDMPRQGLYVDAWFGLLHDVEFHSNIVHDCEWGFAISVEGKDSELKNIAFHHNILYNNRASGIIFGVWGHDRPRSGIEIHHNTICNNGTPGHWAGSTGGIDMRSHQSTNVSIYKNIIFNNWAYEIGLAFEPDKANNELKIRNISIFDNITGQFKDKKSDWSFFERISTGYLPENNKEADPLFTYPQKGDFSIPFDSPAAGAPSLPKDKEITNYYGALKPGEVSWFDRK